MKKQKPQEPLPPQMPLNHAIYQNERHLKLIQSLGNIGSWYLDFRNPKADWTEECCTIFGIDPRNNKHSFEDWLSYIHPDDLAEVKQNVAEAQINFSSASFKCRIIRPDGIIRYIEQTTAFDLDNTGKPLGVYGIVKDITKKKETEQELKATIKELKKYKLALDASAIVSITDSNGNITYVNDKFCEISKYSRKELIGKTHKIINSGYHNQNFFTEMWQAIINGKNWTGEIKNKAKDGSVYWVDSTIVPFMNVSGEPWQYISIRHDITQQKTAQERISNINIELDEQVREKTRQLKDTNEELESFAYSVSHDLRSPLRMINAYATLLQNNLQNTIPSDSVEMLNIVKNYSLKMNDIISNLLNLARIGSKELQKKTINMNTLLQVIVEEQKQTHDLNSTRIIINPLADAYGDIGLVKQLFSNLLSNAVKYSAKTLNATVEVGMASSNDALTYYVKDNGVGFDVNRASQLFKPFQRMHSAEDFEGNGIGLSIVKSIVTKHGGKIRAESKPNEGAVFYIQLGIKQSVSDK